MDSSLLNKFLWILITFLALEMAVNAAYLKEECGFQSANYSIKWAFEPQTQNVVFVLRTSAPTEFSAKEQPINGIGFGREEEINFIGISTNPEDGSMRVLAAKSIRDGQFRLSTGQENDVKIISLKRLSDGDIIATFAVPIKSFYSKGKASKCMTFYFPTRWLAITSDITLTLPTSSTKQQKVCAITDKCVVDVNVPKEMSLKEAKHRDTPVEVSQSVDISGKGDPCRFNGENYDIKWSYNRATNSMDFVWIQQPKRGKWWTAIGIGDNMSDMDIGVIFLNDGVPEGMRAVSSSYDVPKLDLSQDWKLDKENSKWDEFGLLELHFSRKIVTNDLENDRSMDGCVLFQFATNGGSYEDQNNIQKHEDWLDLYKACDLKKHCARRKRDNNEENGENLPVLGHSIDSQNGNNSLERTDHEQKRQNDTVVGDRMISLLMKSIGAKIAQTVEESESENNKTVKDQGKGQQEETIHAVLNGDRNREQQRAFGLKSTPEKKQETVQISEKDGKSGEMESSTIETTNGQTSETTTTPTKLEGQVQQQAGVGSPFSLNAFLGNQSEENLSPVGEPTKVPDTEDFGTTEQARFGINQMLGGEETPEAPNGTLSSSSASSTEIESTTSDSDASVKTSTIGSNEEHPEEQSAPEIDNVLLHSLNNTIGSPENTLTENGTFGTVKTGIASITERVPSGLEENNNTNTVSQQESTTPTTELELISSTPTETSQSPATNLSSSTIEFDASSTISANVTTPAQMEPSTSTAASVGTTSISSTSAGEQTATTITSTSTERSSTIQPSPTNHTDEIPESEEIQSTLSTLGTEETTRDNRVNVENDTNSTEGERGQSVTQQNFTRTVQTSTGPSREPSKTPSSPIKLPVARSKCEALRPDLPICKSYMDNYLVRVKEWADKHAEPMENQFGKACKLLSAVPHVPTLCCQIFAEKCTNHI